ncbi:MAG: thioredoxin domain-containing protein [Candidatus Eiseniibacteriota bacterium]
MSEARRPNHLAGQKSPYLLQHVLNPVDWYPWGEEAFALARTTNRPIFLSIGYATCHWCHVMERESFEDARVAELLNAHFVPIKVDREERPDVDRLYMTALQATGMGGGWPLNAFLTPALEPFYGGTYFPPDARHGRPGMLQVLPRIAQLWRDNRGELIESGRELLAAIEASVRAESSPRPYTELRDRAFAELRARADREHGGFGRAPKFPSVVNLNFLIRVWERDPVANAEALALVRLQLEKMRAGGIHDHLGGGFHRYAVDAHWLVSHFEKMLYDQAQLATAYLEAHQVEPDPLFVAAARGILGYVARDLSAPEGGFYSAEDADSEGEEGRFYAWTPGEITAVLGDEAGAAFAAVYGVTGDGNFEHGRSVLHETRPGPEIARDATLADGRRRLFEARERRPRPLRDDKVLAAWNGLMISAFATGARVLEDPALAARGVAAGTFAWSTMFDETTGNLARRWREGEIAESGQLDDYAFLARGFLDLYQATFDPLWLERAVRLTEEMMRRFNDPAAGGLFESPANDASIRIRMKDTFDGAEIAGNSIALGVLVTLGGLLDREDWKAEARRGLESYAGRLAEYPTAMPQMLVAMDAASDPPRHVVIAAGAGGLEAQASGTRPLIRAFQKRFRPRDFLVVVEAGERQARLARLMPWLSSLAPASGSAAAFVCENYSCRLPVTAADELDRLLSEGSELRPT